jgi:hypothetical protein
MAKAKEVQAEAALTAERLVERLERIEGMLNHRLEQLTAATLMSAVPGMTYRRAVSEIRIELQLAQSELDEEGVPL